MFIRITSLLAVALLGLSAYAQSPIIVDPSSGKYLGDLNNNRFAPNSVSNPYGRYGSQYSPDSINNPYGQYGSPYSNKSANNPYATNPPKVISPYDR